MPILTEHGGPDIIIIIIIKIGRDDVEPDQPGVFL